MFVAWLVVGGPTARAHAIVVGTSPDNGEVLDESPASITITFTEAVTVREGAVTLLDDRGDEVAVTVDTIGVELRITPTAPLADGTHVVSWRVVSADSHLVGGGSVFHVGEPTVADAVAMVDDAPASLGVMRSLADAIVYLGAATAIGAGLFARRWESGAIGRLVRTAAVVALGALVLAVAGRVGELDASWSGVVDADAWRRTLEGPVGWMLGLTAAGLVVLAGTTPSAGLRAGSWITGTVLVVMGFVVEGHTRSASPVWLAIVGGAVHLVAAASWVGGVGALVVERRMADAARRATLAVEVSNLAILAVFAVVVSGVVSTVAIVDDVDTLVSSRWGLMLGIKVVAVAGLVALGWSNRRRIGRRVDVTRSTLRAELALFVVVLGATGVLVASPPVSADDQGGGSVGGTPPGLVDETIRLDSGAGTARLALTPAELGANTLYVTLLDRDGAALDLVWDPTVEVTAPDLGVGPVELVPDRLDDGFYRVTVDLPLAGRWEIAVEARTGTFESGRAAIVVVAD